MEQSGHICILPKLSGLGGPASFRARFSKGLTARGYFVGDNPDDPSTSAILIIGATRHWLPIWRAQKRGVRIVQRLNGMNWVHRKKNTGIKHFLRSEFNNFILSMTRRKLTDRIVYQSQFSQDWWQRVYGPVEAQTSCVYNAVDLDTFSPDGPHQRPQDHIRILLVEGRLGGGYEQGLENAIRLCELLNESLPQQVELMVVGKVPPTLIDEWEAKTSLWINWAGVVTREQIPEIDRSAHLFFSADLNAACPNSVIEALACGCPVVGYRTGALAELVANGAGELVDWGSDYWNLEKPDPKPLAQAAIKVLEQQTQYRNSARLQAERHFDLGHMVEGYLKALLD